jgi:hypothetical protein
MWDSDNQKKQSIRYAENFSSAIRAHGVKNAVFLSSYGAHRLDDAGEVGTRSRSVPTRGPPSVSTKRSRRGEA